MYGKKIKPKHLALSACLQRLLQLSAYEPSQAPASFFTSLSRAQSQNKNFALSNHTIFITVYVSESENGACKVYCSIHAYLAAAKFITHISDLFLFLCLRSAEA